MLNPNKCYDKSGSFGFIYKGTAAELAEVPEGIWLPAEGDSWYDTANNIWKTYDGTNWNINNAASTAAGRGPSPLVWEDIDFNNLLTSPESGFAYFDDFLGPLDVTSGDGYTITQVSTGEIAPVTTEEGGALVADSNSGGIPNRGINVQLANCMVLPAAGKTIAFETRVKFTNSNGAGRGQYAIGLAAIETALIASGALEDTVDKALWFRHDGEPVKQLSVCAARASEEDIDTNKATFIDDTYIKLGFVIDGLTSIKWYADGVLVHTSSVTTNIPNAKMAFSFVSQLQSGSPAVGVVIDWVRIAQLNA
jgi:hypothetical protein